MVGKMGGEAMSHLNSSSGSVEPSLYYPGQKRPGEDGVGNQLAAMGHQRVITEDYKVPDRMVGFIIGRGGEQITRIQLESGCKIQIAAVIVGLKQERAGVKMMMIQDGPMPTGADKPLRISGDPYKVQAARELVLEVIREKDGDFRSGRNDFTARLGGTSLDVRLTKQTHLKSVFLGGRFRSDLSPFSLQVPVPRFAVGIVIGRNGEMIKKIQNDAGVRIQFKAGLFTPG
eukprot:superscaffoldBa00009160_g23903